jgi:hypothetical protein
VPRPPKNPEVAALVDRLRGDLGAGYFTEVPHWDGDLAAIGLASPADLRVLVYLCVMPGAADVFLECELPASRDEPDELYEVASSGSYTDYGQILSTVRDHLAR